MRITYFTTAQEPEEYKKFYIDRKIDANSSNQVFHSNMIDCFSQHHEMLIFSCRSDSTQNNPTSIKTLTKDTWHYLATKKSGLNNLISQLAEVGRVKKYTDIAFVDTTNLRCLMLARRYCKFKRIPMVGIVTDNPANISNQKGITSKLISFYIKKCNGYICLTDKLNELFNKKNKPNVLIKGLNKKAKVSTKKLVDYPYFFYAGTLLKKYGIYDLIDAYNSLKEKEIKLIITGHHEEPEFKETIKDNPNIIYLGNLDNSEIINYENYSIANINPRKFMQEIDDYSIPSKVIEYSSKNSLVISGVSTPLKEEFKDTVLWVEGKNTLAKRLRDAIKMGKTTRSATIKEMNSIAEKRFSVLSNSKKINKLISLIVK